MSKVRILFTGEASFLSTGFATYNREILKRLHATGKYEIAEMGSYAHASDPRIKDIPWRFYPVLPNTQQEQQIYQADHSHQFGKYKIDAVLADFQPDIVFDARDPWMTQHIVNSRFRDKFKLVLMPTVDSAPQKREWIDGIFKKADIITTYSRYGKRVLEKEGVKVAAVTSPGIDLDVFKPLDHKKIRDGFHITPSLLIFGTVMRNQKRKLFPDLFEAYANLRSRHAKPKLVKRAKERDNAGKKLSKDERAALRIHHSALYCHTSYPDLGWDIPQYLYRFGIQRHTIFTYTCDACGAVYASWFTPSDKKGVCVCRQCGERAAHMPNTHKGVDETKLVEIFNLFDVYVQPAICEGWGLPIMESKGCGVPGLYQNYSAMEDHVENGGGLPIKVERFYHEAETSAVRSLPSLEDITKGMERLALDEKLRKRMGDEARQCAVKMHSWDFTSTKLEGIFNSLSLPDRSATWDSYPKYKFISTEVPPQNIDNDTFIKWCYINILGRMPDPEGYAHWMGALENKTSREDVLNFFRNTIISENESEQVRWENSLKLRGIKEAPAYLIVDNKESIMPGVLV